MSLVHTVVEELDQKAEQANKGGKIFMNEEEKDTSL
jgi:hypothetical protein